MTEHTSKELSQRLKDKGFLARHRRVYYSGGYGPTDVRRKRPSDVPAYTFTELWNIVPENVEIIKDGGHTLADFYDTKIWGIKKRISRKMEWYPVEALGLLVEWLIDNGHIEVSQ